MDEYLLIVDDEPSIIAALLRVLRKCDFSILTASNAAQAIELLQENSISVVLSDYRMPEMDGLQLLKRVAVEWPDTTRFLLTGNSDDPMSFIEANDNVVHDVLAKPWSSTALINVIEQAFEHKLGIHTTVTELQNASQNEPATLVLLNTVKLLDINAVEQLVADVTDEMFPELALLFVESSAQRVLRIENAVQTDKVLAEHSEIKHELHTLASSMALYGLARCSKYARYLEHAPADELNQHLSTFAQLSRESLTEFGQLMVSRSKNVYSD